jgi:hypothetical protein|tara:strand:- start:195 stop:566 length:372 start_codon:yes stop_codon:yes gene_type:complete
MTVQVRASDTIEAGIEAIKEASIEDYNLWTEDNSNKYNIRDDFRKEYAEGLSHSVGQKYIKIITRTDTQPSVFCFVVATDSDSKFRRGDVLKPAGWERPARNKPRGNVFDGDFPMKWTGPLYL